MPRRPRISIGGMPCQVFQRGHNRTVCFATQRDCCFYVELLREGILRYRCALHAFVLMPNHVHLLLTPRSDESLPMMMRFVAGRYAQYFNKLYGRTGTLWEGRYRSGLVEDEQVLACYKFIETNPIRGLQATDLWRYRWSSYSYHSPGNKHSMIREHPAYLALGTSGPARWQAYKELFVRDTSDAEVDALKRSAVKGQVVGSRRFRLELEKVVGHPLHGTVGRPKVVSEQPAE